MGPGRLGRGGLGPWRLGWQQECIDQPQRQHHPNDQRDSQRQHHHAQFHDQSQRERQSIGQLVARCDVAGIVACVMQIRSRGGQTPARRRSDQARAGSGQPSVDTFVRWQLEASLI